MAKASYLDVKSRFDILGSHGRGQTAEPLFANLLPLHVENISCGRPSVFFLLLNRPTRTGGVALIFAGSHRHSHSDTSGENKYLVQWSEVKVSLTSAPRLPLGRLLLTGRLRSPNQVSAYRKISLSYQEQPAGSGYARMEAKTDVSTQVWWSEVKKQTEVPITEPPRDEAFGLLPSCCIDFSHLCFSWDFLGGYFGTLRVVSVFSTQQ